MTTLATCLVLYALGIASMHLVDYWLRRRRAARIIKRIVEG